MNNDNLKKGKNTQFTSENQPKKKGRKKGSRNFKTIYKKFLNLKFTKKELKELLKLDIPFIDNENNITIQDAIVLRHIKKTLKSCNYKDISMIRNTIEGLLQRDIKIKQKGYSKEVKKRLKDIENSLTGEPIKISNV